MSCCNIRINIDNSTTDTRGGGGDIVEEPEVTVEEPEVVPESEVTED